MIMISCMVLSQMRVNYQLRRFRGGVISLQRLIEELKYAKGITFQYFFGTERALKKLKAI